MSKVKILLDDINEFLSDQNYSNFTNFFSEIKEKLENINEDNNDPLYQLKLNSEIEEIENTITNINILIETTNVNVVINSENRIGKGNRGAVYKLSDNTKLLKTDSDTDRAVKEHTILCKLYPDYDLKIHLDDETCAFEIPKANGTEAKKYINEGYLSSESERKEFLIKLFMAIKHLHENKILHRDLKLDNIFIGYDNDNDNEMVVTIIDFGRAVDLSQGKDNISLHYEEQQKGLKKKLRNTKLFFQPQVAPEYYKSIPKINPDFHSDFYSYLQIANDLLPNNKEISELLSNNDLRTQVYQAQIENFTLFSKPDLNWNNISKAFKTILDTPELTGETGLRIAFRDIQKQQISDPSKILELKNAIFESYREIIRSQWKRRNHSQLSNLLKEFCNDQLDIILPNKLSKGEKIELTSEKIRKLDYYVRRMNNKINETNIVEIFDRNQQKTDIKEIYINRELNFIYDIILKNNEPLEVIAEIDKSLSLINIIFTELLEDLSKSDRFDQESLDYINKIENIKNLIEDHQPLSAIKELSEVFKVPHIGLAIENLNFDTQSTFKI